MNFWTKIATIFVIILLGACVAPQKNWSFVSPIFMNETARHQIKSTRIVVGLNADSRMGPPLVADNNSGQQYGLVGLLVESAIVHGENDAIQEKQRHLTEINKAVLAFNFGSSFRQAIEDNVKPLEWLKVTYVVKKQDYRIGDTAELLKNMDEDALLVVDCKYIMSDDFSKLQVLTHVSLLPKHPDLIAVAKKTRPYDDAPVLYENLFKYNFPYEETFLNPNDAIAGWSKNDGEMVRRALQASIKDLTQQITADMSAITVGLNTNHKRSNLMPRG